VSQPDSARGAQVFKGINVSITAAYLVMIGHCFSSQPVPCEVMVLITAFEAALMTLISFTLASLEPVSNLFNSQQMPIATLPVRFV
jgi:hypothetical protein